MTYYQAWNQNNNYGYSSEEHDDGWNEWDRPARKRKDSLEAALEEFNNEDRSKQSGSAWKPSTKRGRPRKIQPALSIEEKALQREQDRKEKRKIANKQYWDNNKVQVNMKRRGQTRQYKDSILRIQALLKDTNLPNVPKNVRSNKAVNAHNDQLKANAQFIKLSALQLKQFSKETRSEYLLWVQFTSYSRRVETLLNDVNNAIDADSSVA
ncbi:hypothetical protein MIR68_003281 [Amoeboaphelidium protococcarum]|nr:hypothetical protein MIR68_003281 [Amoeboaphelidium protococcarum]